MTGTREFLAALPRFKTEVRVSSRPMTALGGLSSARNATDTDTNVRATSQKGHI